MHPAMQSQTQWMLRVLIGPQAGADIALKATRYSVGSSAECAIVIAAPHVAPHHLDIFFADGKLSVLQIHAPLRIEGESILRAPYDLMPMTPFAIGDAVLVYGENNAAWPDAENPSLQKLLASDAAEEEEESQSERSKGQAGEEKRPSARKEEDNLQRIKDEEKTARKKQRRATMQKYFRPLRAPLSLVLSGLFCIVFLLLFWEEGPASLLTSPSSPASAPLESPPPLTLFDSMRQKIIQDPRFNSVQIFSPSPESAAHLKGYVKKTDDLNRLRVIAKKGGASMQVISLEKFHRALHVLLPLSGSKLSYELKPHHDGEVEIFIEGLIHEGGDPRKLLQTLRGDIPALGKIHLNVMTAKEVEKSLKDMLGVHKAFQKLSVGFENGKLVISGALLENLRPAWEKIEREIKNTMPGGISPQTKVRFAPPFQSYIVSLLISPQRRHIRLAQTPDGKGNFTRLYQEGDVLPGGFGLKAIKPDLIILEKNGEDYIHLLPDS